MLLLGAAQARAEKGRSLLEVGLAAGAFIPSGQHELYDSRVSTHSHLPKLGFDLSLRATFFPLAYLGLGFEGGYAPIQIEDQLASVFTFRGHLIGQIPWIVTPYVLAGGGTIGLMSKSEALGTDFDRALHWGAGAKVALSDWVSVHLDGRHILTAGRGPGEGNTNHFEVFAGVSVALWRTADTEDAAPVLVERQAEPAKVTTVLVQPTTPAPEEMDCTKAAKNPNCKVEQVVKAELERVHFAWGKFSLNRHDFAALDNAAELLLEHPELGVEIDGHTDSTGPEGHNRWLSRRRAAAVKAYLVKKGVPAERVTAQGHGQGHPIAPNTTATGRASNRRSDIRVINLNDDTFTAR